MSFISDDAPAKVVEGVPAWGPPQWAALGVMALLFLMACLVISRTGARRE